MDRNAVDINFIQKQFLCCVPLNKLQWTPFDELTVEDQKLILDNTVNHDRVEKYPIKRSYVRAFVKCFINELEQRGLEVHDGVYAAYCNLVASNEEGGPTHFRHFVIDANGTKEMIVIQESVSIISLGTTGLCTWQAGLALAEWCSTNKELLAGKKVLELGAGVGLTGLTVVKTSSPEEYIFSDCHPAVLRMLVKNLRINLCSPDVEPDADCDLEKSPFELRVGGQTTTRVRAIRLPWEEIDELEEFAETERNPDLILAADVLYDESNFGSLIAALGHLLRKNTAYGIVAATVRNAETISKFLDMLGPCNLNYEDVELGMKYFLRFDDTPVRLIKITRRMVQ